MGPARATTADPCLWPAAFSTGDQWGVWDGRMAVSLMGIGSRGAPVGRRIDVVDLADDG